MSKVVFGTCTLKCCIHSTNKFFFTVGNVPYNMGEESHLSFIQYHPDRTFLQEQLIDVFKSVGQVVGFRSVSTFSLACT